jgi:uncharacterized membrane protein YkoI
MRPIQHQFNCARHSVLNEPRRGSGDVPEPKTTVKRLFAIVGLCVAIPAISVGAKATPLTLQEAVAKVERETGAKVLSAETKKASKQTVYRIKILTRAGQVKIIEVPAGD